MFTCQVERDVGPISFALHNIGANIGQVSIFDTTTRVYTKVLLTLLDMTMSYLS